MNIEDNPALISLPPRKWGVLPWTTPDGVTPELARDMIIDCARRVTAGELAAMLGVGTEAVRVYQQNAASIPRHVGEKIRAVRRACAQLPPTQTKAADKEIIIKSKDINEVATKKAGAAFKAERLKRGWSVKQFIEAVGRENISDPDHPHNYAEQEEIGISPRARVFFPACELFGIDPLSFGFASWMRTVIENWARERRRDKTTVSAPAPETANEKPPKAPLPGETAAARFGQAVRAARVSMGYTKKQLARRLGVSPSYFYTVEHITGLSPKSKCFFGVCEALRLNPDEYGFTGRYAEKIAKWRAAHPVKRRV